MKELAQEKLHPRLLTLTALAFVETMRMENHTAIVHTAAASNLGQMLVKICKDDGVPLVNIVRKPEQEKILKELGAEYVCNTGDPKFMENLVFAIVETGATLGFDATGGGNGGELASQISRMEIAANKKAKEYSRYGSDTYKQVYIYGGLDPSPTILKRSYGLCCGLGGWLLTPMIGKIGMERFQQMRSRVASKLKRPLPAITWQKFRSRKCCNQKSSNHMHNRLQVRNI